MTPALRFLTVVLVGLVVVALVPAEPPKTPPTKEQIAALIKQLGHDDFDKREEASKKLEEIGQPAEADLTEAAKSKDEEVRRRAGEILEKFKYGIYPDTPKKVVDLIKTYITADDNTRTTIIKELLENGTPGCRAVMKLANVDNDSKNKVMQVISAEMNHAVPSLLAEGNYETLEMFLDISVAGGDKSGMANFGAYYLLRGKLDAGMEKVKNKKEFDAKRQQEILAYLHRANGDLKAARTAAEAAGQPELADEMLFEQGDWKELAKRYQMNAAGNEVEKLGYGAA
jgi:hypothetical protein